MTIIYIITYAKFCENWLTNSISDDPITKECMRLLQMLIAQLDLYLFYT